MPTWYCDQAENQIGIGQGHCSKKGKMIVGDEQLHQGLLNGSIEIGLKSLSFVGLFILRRCQMLGKVTEERDELII